ncbi:MAG: apolipoprotein N-acyltransferase [Burkholderiaceae bacterium]|nr:apolipoprotein N-acyltransferase [Burkholderiaceae bacterium]
MADLIPIPRRLHFPLCLAAGLASVLAFAPFGLWPVQFLALGLLFAILAQQESTPRAFLLGWTYGFGCFIFGVYWPYVSMHNYGDMAPPLAGLAVALFALVLGVFAGLAAALAGWFTRRCQAGAVLSLLAIYPACWLLAEWLRDWLFTGFPWLAAGYAHNASPLAGFAPVLGVFGISWIAALIAGCLALIPITRRPLGAIGILIVAGVLLKLVPWTYPQGQAISVRLLQGNIPQEEKFQNNHIGETLGMYSDMLRAKPADLVATPETAIVVPPQDLPPDYMATLLAWAKASNSHLALGIVLSDAPYEYTNSLIDVSPALKQDNLYRYDKHHLVPFGEFIPYGFHWFVAMLNIPLGDQTSGTLPQKPFAVKDQWVLPNICYEDLFGEEIAANIHAAAGEGRPQPTMLLNVSNMAWFGQWLAVPQHLQISQMRALETGRPVLRSTNTGATAVINPQGVVVQELAPYTRGALEASVQGYGGLTPYIVCGNALVVALAMFSLIFAVLMTRKKRR